MWGAGKELCIYLKEEQPDRGDSKVKTLEAKACLTGPRKREEVLEAEGRRAGWQVGFR